MGDLRILYTLDANDTPCCTLPVVEWNYDGVGDLRSADPEPCGAELYVTWSFSVPVIEGEPTFGGDVPKEAVASGWELGCANGHTLAVSSNQLSAQDSAEQFDPTVLLRRAP